MLVDIFEDPWKLAWIIAHSFVPAGYSVEPYPEFAEVAQKWADRLRDPRFPSPLPGPWSRDGIQAEMAVRDYVKFGSIQRPRNANHNVLTGSAWAVTKQKTRATDDRGNVG